MNKRQKKKLYKKLYGHNPPKSEKLTKCKAGIYARVENTRLQAIYPHIRPETRNCISELMERLDKKTQKAVIQILSTVKRAEENLAEIALHPIPCAQGEMLDLMAEKYGLIRKPHERDDTLRRRILGEREQPCIVVAEVLTRQRAAGRRKKRNYHTRNRRKRKWQ